MKKKVKDEGMEFQRYKKLRKAVRRQPDLRGRYRKVMKAQQQKKRGKGAPEKKEEGGR